MIDFQLKAECSTAESDGTWPTVRLADVCKINPGKPKASVLPADALVTFVPMAAVDDTTGSIAAPEERQFAKVRGSYTAFQDGDVLFAKITPCMENGKSAIARNLTNGLGFGSSEFHVIRPSGKVLPEFIYHYVRQKCFRNEAKENMTGSVGQARVPADWLKDVEIELPGIDEQEHIVGLIEQLQERVESTRGRLATIPSLLKKFRQSVLTAACSGQLTEDWREQHNSSQWEATDLGQVTVRITSGSRDWKQFYGRGTGTFIMAQNVRPGRFDASYRLPVDPPANNRDRERSQVRQQDLLVTIVGANTGDVCPVVEELDQHYVCQSVALVRPKDAKNTPFLNLWLNSPAHGQAYFESCYYGAGRPHLSFDQLRATPVELPSFDEQTEIIRRVESLFALADSVESRLAGATAEVERTSQAILAKAFRGEL